MKIGLTICEYNPFHNGHLYSLNQIKQQLNPDALIVIMSGNFTQRGETAIMHKYERATHAIKAGADIVFELPAVFATAPAEIFAKGAVKLLNEIKGEKTLCFGVESGDKSGLIATATALSNETSELKNYIKQYLKEGNSLAKARYLALEKVGLKTVDLSLTTTPNNILALEYTKAIIENGYDMDILPITRTGTGYKSLETSSDICSAMAIRQFIQDNKKENCKNFVPDYVYDDLPSILPSSDNLQVYSLALKSKEQLKQILDCTEGLENRIKQFLKDNLTKQALLQKLCTKRYTTTRLSRIMLSSMLDISADFIKECLNENLYLKVLAVKENKLSLLSSLSGKIPFIMRKSDVDGLNGTALKCFEKDIFANDIYNQITSKKNNEYHTKIIK
ncbi:MAG: nucleotidyltransferase family protein [Clostridia bacterium]|nr:nucleotidyltransferase family protein [Clostridia bacterium]